MLVQIVDWSRNGEPWATSGRKGTGLDETAGLPKDQVRLPRSVRLRHFSGIEGGFFMPAVLLEMIPNSWPDPGGVYEFRGFSGDVHGYHMPVLVCEQAA
jgi:hypothetical protein